jgi:ADP-ribose pyrophosphatase YjhB (NUDIX family)
MTEAPSLAYEKRKPSALAGQRRAETSIDRQAHDMTIEDLDWLVWARELQAIAQIGLTFCRDPYDRERYEAIRLLAARMFAARADAPIERIESLFAGETGYATPKVDVRAAVFDPDDRVLMVREISDNGRWTLPGGWADVNRTVAQNAIKEALEESGFEVEPVKLAAVWDRTKQGHGPGVFSCCKVFFVCRLIGGRAATSHETSEVGWFHEANIPGDLSLGRVLPQQIRRMFDHRRDPALPTDFD